MLVAMILSWHLGDAAGQAPHDGVCCRECVHVHSVQPGGLPARPLHPHLRLGAQWLYPALWSCSLS